MDTLVNSIKDLVKYKLVNYVNTGDKTFDNLLNTVFIIILGFVFNLTFWSTLRYTMLQYKQRLINRSTQLNKHNIEYYKKLADDRSLTFTSWNTSDNKKFTENFTNYLVESLGWYFSKSFTVVYDMEKMTVSKSGRTYESRLENIKTALKPDEKVPIFVNRYGNIITIHINANKDMLIGYENIGSLEEFVKYVKSFEKSESELTEKEEKKEQVACRKIITSIGDSGYSNLYSDRTFDMIISKYKQMILNTLDDFEKSLINKSVFNGYGSYNLGIMLHGLPGTGKTSLIKAICNKLGRHAYVIDMRTIKTSKDFEGIFYDDRSALKKSVYREYVYVLEEFDCVQGIIDRSLTNGEEKNEKPIENELREQYMRILEMQGKATDAAAQKSFSDELEKVRKQMLDMEKKLTIDSILTILDGMVEMRGRVIIATTNHIDRIDKALLREGRFDLKIKLEAFTEDETRELLHYMFRDIATPEEMEMLDKAKLKDGEFTPAQLVNLCHKYQTLPKVLSQVSLP